MARVAVLDVGSGNIPNVERAMRFLGADTLRIADADHFESGSEFSHVVLPGVGHFATVMSGVRDRGFDTLVPALLDKAEVPLLGICVGLQVMFEHSDEADGCTGLGILPGAVQALGTCKGIAVGAKIPHMGWNRLEQGSGSALLRSLEGRNMYFVHSYAAPVGPWTLSTTTYAGCTFSNAVRLGARAFAVQFHPEKSGQAGMHLLQNFLEI